MALGLARDKACQVFFTCCRETGPVRELSEIHSPPCVADTLLYTQGDQVWFSLLTPLCFLPRCCSWVAYRGSPEPSRYSLVLLTAWGKGEGFCATHAQEVRVMSSFCFGAGGNYLDFDAWKGNGRRQTGRQKTERDAGWIFQPAPQCVIPSLLHLLQEKTEVSRQLLQPLS